MGLRGSARRREIQLAYLLLSPALLLLLTVLAYPVGWELWTSLTDLSPISDGPQAFVGFENYRRFLGEAEFWRAAAVTVVYAAVTSVAKLALGLGFALLLASAFADLANVWMLTAGRIVFPVIGTHAYWLAIKAGQFGPASALSLTLIPFLLGVLFLLFRLFDPPEREAA